MPVTIDQLDVIAAPEPAQNPGTASAPQAPDPREVARALQRQAERLARVRAD
jgi:hypothetical protein